MSWNTYWTNSSQETGLGATQIYNELLRTTIRSAQQNLQSSLEDQLLASEVVMPDINQVSGTNEFVTFEIEQKPKKVKCIKLVPIEA